VLLCGVVYVILRLAVLVELRLVTDRQTDRLAMASTADAWHRAVKRGGTSASRDENGQVDVWR